MLASFDCRGGGTGNALYLMLLLLSVRCILE
jgi:hypothetical protein